MVLNPDNILFYKNTLKDLEDNDLFREIKTFDVQKNSLKYKNSTVKNFSSNDYLGLSKNKIILNRVNKLKIPQISQCSSQLISGSSSKIKNLEKNLSLHRNVQSSLIFPNGYMANLGVLSALGDKDTIIFSDKLNHASIIDGCKLSHSKIEIFQHNDFLNLEDLVKKSKFKRKIIITEGIFSMDGDFSNLKEISKIAKENECILIVDDAHGDFIIGNENKKNYAGTPDFFNINEQIDIHISSLSKGLGCFGGYVASSELISKYLINKSRPFIFTSAIPEFLCELANISLKISKDGTLQNKLYSNIDYFHKVIDEYPHYEVQKRRFSPIIPIIIGSEKKTIEISRRLLKEGFFIQAIRYPTVKKNKARLRVSISAEHKKKQIRNLIHSLNKITKAI
ncbi:MAG TPA: pyridoxal phosphate-dependent aminotransferase family protein [Candidatus Sulfopaludibacter sp.]|nr:pyridoxal phosphate-dependent aminotransferase family protein [Candidatus Sulfopaludibacter sp.]